jgi:hypothetical protein
MENDHEDAFSSSFVIPEKRARYAEFLRNPKRRPEALDRLNHFFDFVPRLATEIDRGGGRELGKRLRKLGAPDEAQIIGGGKADGKKLPLEDAIDTGMSEGWGVVISCIPGRLALYVKEFPRGDTFILRRES